MPHRMQPAFWMSWMSLGLMVWSGLCWGQEPRENPPSQGDLRFFESKVRPLLIEKCYPCHSLDSNLSKGGLRLDTREATRRGGDSGPAFIAGAPETSMLLRAVDYRDPDLQMPPPDSGGKLTAAEIEILKQWIRKGAPDPREETYRVPPDESMEHASEWWAYQPLKGSEAPVCSPWAWNEIDHWVEKEYRRAGIAPMADAEPSTLLRRLAFDLTGLPPSIEDIREFSERMQTTSRREAIETMVDRLLDSDDFGPHWGRHWLDVARYGESSGRDVNVPYNFAWRYRDWVIDAFQRNMPLDRFLVAQIAGDQLPFADESERAANLVATGFLAIGSRNFNENNPLQIATDQADEQIDTVFQAMMGTTFACARCHDHKFDPIAQHDYTAVAGIFLSSDTRFGAMGGNNLRNAAPAIELPPSPSIAVPPSPWSDEQLVEKRNQLRELKARRDVLNDQVKAQRKEMGAGKQQELRKVLGQLAALEFQLTHVDADGRPRPLAMGVVDKPMQPETEPSTRARAAKGKNAKGPPSRRPGFNSIGDSPLFARGEISMPGEQVPRSVPHLFGDPQRFAIPAQTSGRLQIAHWMVSDENPLTPRVAANRIWSWLMGHGIVETVDNFGTTGTLPSHPELLDNLALEFRENGWDTKALIRKIATSRTYQLASVSEGATAGANLAVAEDPENRLYWRGKRRRLQAEEIRDSMLLHAGRLDRSRPIASTMAKHFSNKIDLGQGRKRSKGELFTDEVCRSVYLPLPRSMAPEVLELFDLPDGSFVQGVREATNVPSHSLYLLNSPQVAGHATAVARMIAQRIPGRGSQHFDERATLLWQILLARPPASDELEWAKELWATSNATEAGWVSLVRGLFATAEYRYLD